jgi:hypothetical protein
LAQQTSSGHVPRDLQEYKSDQPGIYRTRFPKELGKAPLTAYHFVRMESALSDLGHVVQDCDAILIVINLSCYHQIDDNQRPRIMNELDLFESVITSDSLKNMALFLIFVKSPIFEHDLSTHPLKVYFPDYPGQDAEAFISAQFEKIRSKDIVGVPALRDTYSLWTHPGDAHTITRWIYAVIQEAIKQKVLRSIGLI